MEDGRGDPDLAFQREREDAADRQRAKLDYALTCAERAREALDDALDGYGHARRKDRGAIELRVAFRAVEEAIAEVEADREHVGEGVA